MKDPQVGGPNIGGANGEWAVAYSLWPPDHLQLKLVPLRAVVHTGTVAAFGVKLSYSILHARLESLT
jgi:hypothetical protein